MHIVFLFIGAAIYFSAASLAGDCENVLGMARGECVQILDSSNCNNLGIITSYKPTCKGNCFQYDSFQGIDIAGDGTFGTSCTVYSDGNCQNEILSTQNVKHEKCYGLSTAGKSMKCYYQC